MHTHTPPVQDLQEMYCPLPGGVLQVCRLVEHQVENSDHVTMILGTIATHTEQGNEQLGKSGQSKSQKA